MASRQIAAIVDWCRTIGIQKLEAMFFFSWVQVFGPDPESLARLSARIVLEEYASGESKKSPF